MQDGQVKRYKRDLRWPAAIALTVLGIVVVFATRWITSDSWWEFGVIAAYSVGWAMITFAVLYVLSGVFDSWKWGREDHDLVRIFDRGLE